MLELLNNIISHPFINTMMILIGGSFAFYKYIRRNEKASLSVKIDEIDLIINENVNFFSVEATIENLGNREVHLYYNYEDYKAQLSLYKINKKGGLEFVAKKIGLASAKTKYTGRLRSQVSIRLPYLLEVKEPGVYFLEFTIDIGMKKHFKRNDNKDLPMKVWSDRKYYNLSNSELNS